MKTELKSKNQILKPKFADIFIIMIPVLIAVLSIIVMYFVVFPNNDTSNKIADISVNGKTVLSVDLSTAKNGIIELTQKLSYNNIIEIKDGKIGIVSADCKDKTCVESGFISTPGQIIACVPSKLIITVRDKTDGDIDAVTK